MSTDTRYPYTHAADYIRAVAGHTEGGTKLSRGVASSLVKKGLVEVFDNEGRGKANDMAIVPTQDGYVVCVQLGYTKE